MKTLPGDEPHGLEVTVQGGHSRSVPFSAFEDAADPERQEAEERRLQQGWAKVDVVMFFVCRSCGTRLRLQMEGQEEVSRLVFSIVSP